MKRILFFVLLAISARAQSVEERIKALGPELNARLDAFKKKQNLASVSYAIVYNGKVVHQNFDGFIEKESKRPATAQSVYRIASMSKSFAGVAVLQLRDAGRLKLEAPVYQYIPELSGQSYSSDSPDITIRHLLTHAAGFPEDNPWGDRQLGISTEEMLAMFKKGISFSTEPGQTYEYSNMAFAMLGYIISQVSGQTYQEYIQEHIWNPLGMKDTYWDYTKVPKDQLVHGYRYFQGDFVAQPIEGDGAYGIMGGILTSTEDFCKYMAFHQGAYLPELAKPGILKTSSLREMHFPWNFNSLNKRGYNGQGQACENVSHYGYGLRLDQNCEQIKMVGHSGGLPGYGSDWKILPQYGLGIVTLTNGTYGSAALLNNEILPYIVAKAHVPATLLPVSPILKQRQSELMSILPEWKEAPIFAVNFFADYYIEVLKEETGKVFESIGKIKKVNEMVAENALRGYFIIEGEKGKARISFTLSPENPPLIQAYTIHLLP
ncbi:serine hydrolase domain-containing protein [Leadbetterella byssophila]|uniref:serine hydrolase domain-containing protein n=1 Tax=Leadbetterella byssophila TaxID=316068 RepID=UPI0039A320E4